MWEDEQNIINNITHRCQVNIKKAINNTSEIPTCLMILKIGF